MNIQLPMGSAEWRKAGVVQDEKSLMTPLALMEGEVLETLETSGPMALASVLETSQMPMPLVIMSVGALVRDGLVRATKSRENILLESIA